MNTCRDTSSVSTGAPPSADGIGIAPPYAYMLLCVWDGFTLDKRNRAISLRQLRQRRDFMMLWRLFLSAVAVSCTLPRTHAHGPRDRIKDLVCVLLLSGMQKEDLDVSVLNKLQRYNVNIHGANNEDLLKECAKLRDESNNDTVNATLGYFTTKGVPDDLKENYSAPNIQKIPIQSDQPVLIQTYNTKIDNNNDGIQYAEGKPRLDSVLKFWNGMKLDKRETTESHGDKYIDVEHEKNVREQKNKRNVANDDDGDDIKRLLENYFTRKNNNNRNENYQDNEQNTQNIHRGDSYKVQHPPRQDERKLNDDFDSDRSQSYLSPFGDQKGGVSPLRILPAKEEIKPHERNYSDIVAALGKLNNRNEDKSKHSKENGRLLDNSYLRKYMDTERFVTTTDREREQKFSSDMIKEIANSVKELVLRDIKLKIQDTTTSSTTTSTTTTITKAIQSINDNNIKIQESVLNKFLEMFEEIKSLKRNTVVISSSNNKQNIQHLLPPPGKTKQMQYSNPYGIQYPKANSQINFNFGPQEHKFRTNEGRVTARAPSKPLIPITFQTNNLEIPPLGIPIDEPLNPINQNIVVTTEIPYRIGVIKNELKPRNNPFADSKRNEEYIQKQSHKTRHDNSNVPSKDDVIRFSLNNAAEKHKNYYKHSNNYHPRSNNLAYIKAPDVPRYHERLENVDSIDVPDKKRYSDRVDCCNEKYAYSKQMVECCNRKVASRQQMSLNNMKKGSYDDTHFKNFLKTQQKVTNMLERILATRDRVRSVETT